MGCCGSKSEAAIRLSLDFSDDPYAITPSAPSAPAPSTEQEVTVSLYSPPTTRQSTTETTRLTTTRPSTTARQSTTAETTRLTTTRASTASAMLSFPSLRPLPYLPSTPKDANIIPKLGVKIRFLQEFLSACPGGKDSLQFYSTADVCEKLIKPYTQSCNLSLCELLRHSGHDSIGEATVFISHARLSRFMDLVSSLASHFMNNIDTIVWIDVFSVNQHIVHDSVITSTWLTTVYADTIKWIGHTVLVMSPWQNFIPLTRLWCLYELYCSSRVPGCRIELAVNLDEKELVITDIINNTEKIANKMKSWIHIMKSECSRIEDRDSILDAIRTMITMDKRTSSLGTFDSTLEHNVVPLLTNIDNDTIIFDDCKEIIYKGIRRSIIQILSKQYQQCIRTLGSEHTTTISQAHNLAITFTNQYDYIKAEPMFLYCYEKDKVVFGETHRQTLHTMRNLALIYRDCQKFSSSLTMYERCYTLYRQTLGKEDPITIEVNEALTELRDAIGSSNNGNVDDIIGGLKHSKVIYLPRIHYVPPTNRNDYTVIQATTMPYAPPQSRVSYGEWYPDQPIKPPNTTGRPEVPYTPAPPSPDSQFYTPRILPKPSELEYKDRPLGNPDSFTNKTFSIVSEENQEAELLSWSRIALTYGSDDKYEDALPLFISCYEGYDNLLKRLQKRNATNHEIKRIEIDLYTVIENLGNCYVSLNQIELAVPLLQLVCEKKIETTSNHCYDADTLETMVNLTVLYGQLGQHHEKALKIHEAVYECNKQLHGETNRNTLSSMDTYAFVLHRLQRHNDALLLSQQCVELANNALGSHDSITLYAMSTLGEILLAMSDIEGRQEEGLSVLEDCYARCLQQEQSENGQANAHLTLTVLHHMGAALIALGDEERAQALLNECLEKRRMLLGENHPDTWKTASLLESFSDTGPSG